MPKQANDTPLARQRAGGVLHVGRGAASLRLGGGGDAVIGTPP